MSRESKTKILTVLHTCFSNKLTNNTKPPRVAFSTFQMRWTARGNPTEEVLNSLKECILKSVRLIVGNTDTVIVILGWDYAESEIKECDIAIHNTVLFSKLAADNGLFVTEQDLREAQKSSDKKLSKIFQKRDLEGAVNIFGGILNSNRMNP